jgi:hypothetical protein
MIGGVALLFLSTYSPGVPRCEHLGDWALPRWNHLCCPSPFVAEAAWRAKEPHRFYFAPIEDET